MMLDVGSWKLDVGSWELEAGSWINWKFSNYKNKK